MTIPPAVLTLLFFVHAAVCVLASDVVIKRFVEQGGNVCIVAELAATFYVDYTDVSGISQTSTLEVGDNAVVQNRNNECGEQMLALKFENDRFFSMKFSLNESTHEVCVTNIMLKTKLDAVTFPGHASIGEEQVITFNETSFCSGKQRMKLYFLFASRHS